MPGRADWPGGFRWCERRVGRSLIGMLDSAQLGGDPGFAGGDGLACAENLICPGGSGSWVWRRLHELVALLRPARCEMMIGCAASTGLSECDERVCVVTTCWLRPGC